MTLRLVKDDYEIDGISYQLWTETEFRDDNFTLTFGGVEQDLTQFSEKQLQAIDRYVADWRAPGGH